MRPMPYVIVEIASTGVFLLELSLILKIECYVSCTMSYAFLEMSLSIVSQRQTSISNDVISPNHNYCLFNCKSAKSNTFHIVSQKLETRLRVVTEERKKSELIESLQQSILSGGPRKFLLFSKIWTCGIGQVCPPNKGDSL